MYKIDSQGEPSLVLRGNLEEWDGMGAGERFKREGTYVYFFGIVVWHDQHNTVK